MGPEIWIGVLAVFVSGGAIGSAGTLLAQWLLRKMGTTGGADRVVAGAEHDRLRADVARMYRHIQNMDVRLDFTERLLDGAIPTAPAPERLIEEEPGPDEDADTATQ